MSFCDIRPVFPDRITYLYRVSKNVLYRVSEKYKKYQINNEPNYYTCNRMFDICSSYCEYFIYISLSIAMWHGFFENWWITKMPFQRKRSIPYNITQTNRSVEFIIFSREKHNSWTIFDLNHRLNNKKVEKSSSYLKRVKNSLESVKLLIIRELNYQIIHSRGKVIPLNRWNEVLLL